MARLTLPAKEAGSESFPKATLQFLNFTGESVVATDTHILAVLKNYKSEPHLGHADGPVHPVSAESLPGRSG